MNRMLVSACAAFCLMIAVGMAHSPLYAAEAGALDMSSAMAAGRAALRDNSPKVALGYFQAALRAMPPDDSHSRFVALQGLGHAAYWLGQYALAEVSYREALSLAVTEEDKTSSTVRLARTLTARDRPRDAYWLVAPLLSSNREAAVEGARASLALGWDARAAAAISVAGRDTTDGAPPDWLDRERARIATELTYRRSRKLKTEFEYARDSDGLRSQQWSVEADFPADYPGVIPDAAAANLTAGARVLWLDDDQRNLRLDEVDVSYRSRYGDSATAYLVAGAGEYTGHTYTAGSFGLAYRPADAWGLELNAEKAPVMTLAALNDEIDQDSVSVGADVLLLRAVTVAGAVYQQSFSDGNDRRGEVLRITSTVYPFLLPDSTFRLQLQAHHFRNDAPAATGYFNPDEFREVRFNVIISQQLSPAWRVRATVSAGTQRIGGSDFGIASGELQLNGRLYRMLRTEIGAGYGDSAAFSSSGAGYRRSFIRASLVMPW